MNRDELNFISDDSISVDSILAEFKAESAVFGPPPGAVQPEEWNKTPPQEPVPPAEGVHHIVYDSREQAIGAMEIGSDEPDDGGFVSYAKREPDAATAFTDAVYSGGRRDKPQGDSDASETRNFAPQSREQPRKSSAPPERDRSSETRAFRPRPQPAGGADMPPVPDEGGGRRKKHRREGPAEEHYSGGRYPEDRQPGERPPQGRYSENTRPGYENADGRRSERGYREDGYASAHVSSERRGESYASRDYGDREYYPDEDYREPDFKEKVVSPLMALLGLAAAKRQEKQRAKQQQRPDNAQPRREEPPELRADKASGFYAAQAQSLKLRSLIATGLTVALIYLSYGLPAFGLLGKSPSVRSLVCLVLELAVMVTGLDVMTNGLTSLVRLKPGAESLTAVSCIITGIDALVIAITGKTDVGLPFCGVSALSVVMSLWGSRLSCEAFAISFRTAARAHDPNVVISISGVDEDGCILAKARRPVTGFVRTAETADIFENAYRLVSPILLIGSFIISLFCFFASENCTDLLHTLATCVAGTASLSSVFGFAYPFWVQSKRLAKSNVSIAGYSGAAELGRLRRVMITDSDIFPPSTLSIADVALSEGSHPRTVISCTGSIIAASGMGIAPAFTELMRKNGCPMQRVEDFACHEGGGLVARVNGDQVFVGTASFMQLMGVKVPKGQVNAGSTVFTAINGSLAGIFTLNYKPVATVQRALVALLRAKIAPIFAIRDFNITPMFIKQKFRLPTKSFDFPSFADRYMISSREVEDSGTVTAMFARGGLNSVSGLISRGRKLYNASRLLVVLSIFSSIFVPVLMMSLCWSGSYDSASCGNLITYMLLWLLPVFAVSIGLKR